MISENKELQKECLKYLKSEKILDKMIRKFLEKYRSYEGAVGSIVLEETQIEDVETLEGFFGIGLRGKRNISISAARVDKALLNTKFSGVTLEQILKAYDPVLLLSNREVREMGERKKELFFQNMAERFSDDSFVKNWLLESGIISRSLAKKYNADAESLESMLYYVMKALDELPRIRNNFEYLPVFATKITENPHYFDANTSAYNLLTDGIIYYVKNVLQDFGELENWENRMEEGSFERNISMKKLLFKVGLLPDGISNNSTVYGIRGFQENQKEHLGIKGFYEQEEAVNLSLSTIMWLREVRCVGNCLYIVENPSIFVELVDKFKHRYAVMCINGQPNFASLILLETIRKSGNQLYYAGDFDPEGLVIAENLMQYCKKELTLWKMNSNYYEKALSGKPIEEKRLKMLNRLENPDLVEIGKRMKVLKRAGYQEKIVDEYLNDAW